MNLPRAYPPADPSPITVRPATRVMGDGRIDHGAGLYRRSKFIGYVASTTAASVALAIARAASPGSEPRGYLTEVRARRWRWEATDHTHGTRGVLLHRDEGPIFIPHHLLRALADRLHDLADELEEDPP